MLATRCLRLAVNRSYTPAVCAWSGQMKTPLKFQQTSTPWYTKPMMAAAYSKDAKPNDESPNQTPIPFSSNPTCDKTKSTSKSPYTERGPLSDLDVKLPNREQVESFFFKSLVYLWDFVAYVLSLSRRLFENYILCNGTVQQYWKMLMKRLDDARREIKSK